MIEERSYGLRPEFDGEVAHIGFVHHIVIIGTTVQRGQSAEDQLWRPTNFIAHHGMIELHIIAFGYETVDEARQNVIETLFNMPKMIDCATISDAMTPRENEVWLGDIPF